MAQYNTLNAKLSNSQLITSKYGIKNGTEVTLNLSPNLTRNSQYSQESRSVRVSFNKIGDLKTCKGTPTQEFSCKYCKIFKSLFLQNTSSGCFCKMMKILQTHLLTFSLTD